jgi:hypothetical protein
MIRNNQGLERDFGTQDAEILHRWPVITLAGCFCSYNWPYCLNSGQEAVAERT